MNTENHDDLATTEQPQSETPATPRWRPAPEPTCCGGGCDDCPF
jgi:hypothetical protein